MTTSKPSSLDNSSSANPLVLVVSGPSGVGKDAILNRMKERKFPFTFITTVTTRKRRPAEKDGVDYHFISPDDYQKILAKNGFLESAQVYGNWYGVPKEPVKAALTQGKDTIIKVDIQGAANIKKVLPEAVFIFILAPSAEELSKRLCQRQTETLVDLELRLKTAEKELREISKFDYAVMNPCNDVESAINDLMSIVRAEKCRTNPRRVAL
jgi:guanylate kinase